MAQAGDAEQVYHHLTNFNVGGKVTGDAVAQRINQASIDGYRRQTNPHGQGNTALSLLGSIGPEMMPETDGEGSCKGTLASKISNGVSPLSKTYVGTMSKKLLMLSTTD